MLLTLKTYKGDIMTNTFELKQFNTIITYPYDLDYVKTWVELVILNDKIDYSTRFDALCSMYQSASKCEYFYEILGSQVLYNVVGDHVEPMTFESDHIPWFDNIVEAKSFYDHVVNCIKLSNYNATVVDLVDKASKYVKSNQKKRQRLKRFIEKHLFLKDKYCYFITYTFSNEELNKKEATRTKKMHSLLKSMPGLIAYACNKDFGEQHDREHYHILLSTSERIDYEQYQNNIDFELCNTTTKDKERIAKYITKLANHGVKSSTKNARIYKYIKK